MKNARRTKGIKLDGTPKKITVPSRRGAAWDSMLDEHYEEIRLRRARGGPDNILKKLAADFGCAVSTLSSYIRTHSDGTRPYTLRNRSAGATTSVPVPHFSKSTSTLPPLLHHTTTPVTVGDAVAGIPFDNDDHV